MPSPSDKVLSPLDFRGLASAVKEDDAYNALMEHDRALRALVEELSAALERLGSTEGFCGAFSLPRYELESPLWKELRARGEFARAVLEGRDG